MRAWQRIRDWVHQLSAPLSPRAPVDTYDEPMTVRIRDRIETWTSTVDVLAHHQDYRLTIRAPDGRSWWSEGGDVFSCLAQVRRQLEPLGYRLCCNGARRNAFVSGMARDMGQGLTVYLAAPGMAIDERPKTAATLGPAPCSDVVSNKEQDAWIDDWWNTACRIARARNAATKPSSNE
jgi:hypothetical protein